MKKISPFAVITGLLLFVCYGSVLFSAPFYIDEEYFVNRPGFMYFFLEDGRFSMALTRWGLGFSVYEPYFEGLIFLVLAFYVCRGFVHLFQQVDEKIPEGILTVASCLMMCSLIFAEQFQFQFQAVSLMLAFLAEIAANLLLIRGLREGVWKYVMAGIPLLIFAFGTYQAMVNIQLALYFAVFMLMEYRKEENTLRRTYMITAQFFAAFVIYEVLVKLFFSGSMEYLSDQIMWGQQPILDTFRTIRLYMKVILLHVDFFTTWAYPTGLIVFTAGVIAALIRKKISVLGVISAFALSVSPFFLLFLMGTPPTYRGQLTLPAVCALMWSLGVFLFVEEGLGEKTRKKKRPVYIALLVIASCLLYLQTAEILRLHYTRDVVREADRMEAVKLTQRIDAFDTNKPVVFVGCLNAKRNPSCYTFEETGSYMTLSVYELRGKLGEASDFHNTRTILGYLESLGYPYAEPTAQTAADAVLKAADMPEWPAEGSVREEEDCIIVRLQGNADKDFGK